MKYGKLAPTPLLAYLFIVGLVAQVRPPQYPPPDIIPPEVLKTRDALQVDTQHYRLEFENDKMRVLRLTLKPSETVPMHDDRDALVVCLSEGMPRAVYVPKWPLGGHPHGSWYVAVDLRRNAIGEELGDQTRRDVVRGNEECECTVVPSAWPCSQSGTMSARNRNMIYLKSFLGGLAGLMVASVMSAVILMIDSLSRSSLNNTVSFDWLAISAK